jgi:AcrR family transcriptional regulator
VRRAYHHGNLREALVEQGVKLIEEKGANALTLREIGDRIGVSRTAAYRHFADKSELFKAIRETAFTDFADRLESARDGAEPSCFARLEAMGHAYLKFAQERRAYYEVMFGATEGSPSPAGDRAFQVLAGTIEDGQRNGEIREGDPQMMATLVWAMVHGLATLQVGESLMPSLSDLLRNGLRR